MTQTHILTNEETPGTVMESKISVETNASASVYTKFCVMVHKLLVFPSVNK